MTPMSRQWQKDNERWSEIGTEYLQQYLKDAQERVPLLEDQYEMRLKKVFAARLDLMRTRRNINNTKRELHGIKRELAKRYTDDAI